MTHRFKKGNEFWKSGQDALRKRNKARQQSKDEKAKMSDIPLERAFTYSPEIVTEEERHRKTWDHEGMDLYFTLRGLGR